MIVVLDINVLLVSIPKKSPYRSIFDALINGKFELVLTNDILSEYIEVLQRKANPTVALNIAETLLNLEHLRKIDIYFQWNLIEKDPDDNKYADAAITGGADFLITNDQHFNILKSIAFPKVNTLTIESFLDIIKNH